MAMNDDQYLPLFGALVDLEYPYEGESTPDLKRVESVGPLKDKTINQLRREIEAEIKKRAEGEEVPLSDVDLPTAVNNRLTRIFADRLTWEFPGQPEPLFITKALLIPYPASDAEAKSVNYAEAKSVNYMVIGFEGSH
jgi:hypothetical protein